ncbi:dirigent protein 21-like [Eucalyptus grandis]|uniref:dirigent protein 21-like n=1 Tax=Eucalyptus grandis TaxID=71139 RepID=UPI00192ED7FD|nr:dirigent protein 21-like [Eucalyptus grandis]
MARSLPKLILITLFFPLTIFAARSQTSARSLSIEAGPRRLEKLSHLHFYLHEMFTGPNFTATQVASAPTSSQSATSFGTVIVIDDMLKLGPDAGSKLVGQAQGLTSSVSQSGSALLMAANFVFSEGTFNGSRSTLEYARKEQLGARGEEYGDYRRDWSFPARTRLCSDQDSLH